MTESIDFARLQARLTALSKIGRTERGGASRLAFTQADKDGRDLVVSWMRAAGLAVSVDAIGNIFGLRQGRDMTAHCVMTGSHIDTVGDGGHLDGTLGVLAGLEVVERLNELGAETERPICVAVFSNEEGVRFQPDMMGSLVFAGGLDLDAALSARDRDDVRLGDALEEIAYAGPVSPGEPGPHCFVELHIEQGPVLEEDGIQIGAVDALQGISWTRIELSGQSNHAGTTPMRLRRDAGLGAARIIDGIRRIADDFGGDQVSTCGELTLLPGLINVVPRTACLTVDLRNTDDALLQKAEARLAKLIETVCEQEGLKAQVERIARFEPVSFDASIVQRVEHHARTRGLSFRRMTSGAGHDAQMISRLCPAAMIFTPSIKGISHNPAEATHDSDLEAGANVLFDVLRDLAG